MWKFDIPAKVENFMCPAISNVLPTADLLRARKVDIPHYCPVCLEDTETIFHCLIICSYVRRVWSQSSVGFHKGSATNFKDWVLSFAHKFGKEDWCQVSMLCWALWHNRNNFVWNGTNLKASYTAALARTQLQQWQEAKRSCHGIILAQTPAIQQPSQWRKPPTGNHKLNVDAAIFKDEMKVAFGMVIWDVDASFIAANAIALNGIFEPNVAEAMGVREALSWLKEKFPNTSTIEFDAKLVHHALD